MTPRILKTTLKQALIQCRDNLMISWQGGEPTLMGLDFYKQAVAYEKQFGRGKTVSNAFQTNGILLNDKWADFFQTHQFLVGLSIDGPEHIHDHYRVSPKGDGSWKRVHTNAEKLLKKGVAVNAMTCLTDYSVAYPDQIYDHHKETGLIYMQFIPVVEWETPEKTVKHPFSVKAEAYGEFLCRVFDLWLADFKERRPTTSVRLFESTFFRALGKPSPQCTFRETCGQYLVVEHNGDVYPCDFYVTPEWKLGNVEQDRLESLLNTEKHYQFSGLKRKTPPPCSRCRYRQYCHGGCTKDRYPINGAGTENYFCKAYTMFFDHALPTLQDLARRWEDRGQ